MATEVSPLLDFLVTETEKLIEENPNSIVEEHDLSAFLYMKITQYFEEKEIENWFIDADEGKTPELPYDKITKVHCEYPRVAKVEINDESTLKANRGRYDIVILRKPTKEEKELVGDYVNYYPVDVAFEVHAGWDKSDNYIAHKLDSDARVFGWNDNVYNPNLNIKSKKEVENALVRREYPDTGIVFHIYFNKEKKNLGNTEKRMCEIKQGINKYREREQRQNPPPRFLYIKIKTFSRDGFVSNPIDEKIIIRDSTDKQVAKKL